MDASIKTIVIEASKNPIVDLEGYIKYVRNQLQKRRKQDNNSWQIPWFRGEQNPNGNKFIFNPLIPKLYRKSKEHNFNYNENKLLQHFRMKAPIFSQGIIPSRDATDQWLFLAQHVGLPTRLLDWTESALIALYFALLNSDSDECLVWVLDPISLNKDSETKCQSKINDEFPLTWYNPKNEYYFYIDSALEFDEDNQLRSKIESKDLENIRTGMCLTSKDLSSSVKKVNKGANYYCPIPNINIGNINIRGAWEKNGPGTNLPIAILPTVIHPRMSVQRSCFTIHGKEKKSIAELVPKHLICMVISKDIEHRQQLKSDLQTFGISHATIFPDLDGLATELQSLDYFKK